jgi:uncharacterized protein involved in outer membrane biogenesis
MKPHPILKWTAVGIGGLLAVIVVALAFADWNALRPTIARMITARTGRPASIGHLDVHLWSMTPSVDVEHLSIGNPDWADRKQLFTVDQLVIEVSLAHLLEGHLLLPRVELHQPVVNLERDANGRASWDMKSSSSSGSGAHLPAVRLFVIDNGKVHMVDQIRKLSFDGSVTAGGSGAKGVSGRPASAPGAGFSLACSGSLNARPFSLKISGGELLDVDPDKPYDFTAQVSAGDLNLKAQGTFPRPFDLAEYHGKFTISGNDLADAYYLTNLALPNTAPYQISGALDHVGTRFTVKGLKGRVGNSDLEADLSVLTGGERPKLIAHLTATSLDMADLAPTLGKNAPTAQSQGAGSLGAAAVPQIANATSPSTSPSEDSAAPASAPPMTADAGEAPPSPNSSSAPPRPSLPKLLLPDADLQVNRVRGMDADVTFDAASVTATKAPLKQVKFHLTLQNGVLRFDPLSFGMDQGQFSGTVVIDASGPVPESTIDMGLQNVNLAEFKSAGSAQAPLDGLLEGRVQLRGAGTSVHKFASDADGIVSLAIPHGDIRSVFAELTGVNVARGLGLLITGDQSRTELRCGVADFQARDGHLDSQTVVLDTTNVLITGSGYIDLRTEKMDLSLKGDPKKLRFVRLRTPISLGGTLSKPSFGVKPEQAVVQAGAATALGTLLTPLAAALAFIDPGLAKNANCATLLAQAKATPPDTAQR